MFKSSELQPTPTPNGPAGLNFNRRAFPDKEKSRARIFARGRDAVAAAEDATAARYQAGKLSEVSIGMEMRTRPAWPVLAGRISNLP